MPSESTSDEIYHSFRQIPVEAWNQLDASKFEEALKSRNKELLDEFKEDGVSLEAAQFRVMGKIANEYDEEVFHDFLEGGELPPLELTDEEMEAVKGGGFWADLGDALLEAAGQVVKDFLSDLIQDD